jgi:hypothetical protein
MLGGVVGSQDQVMNTGDAYTAHTGSVHPTSRTALVPFPALTALGRTTTSS